MVSLEWILDFLSDIWPSPCANDGVGSPAEDEECHMDDRHFQCFQHRPLGRAHRDFFRRLAIFIGAKKVLLGRRACLDLTTSPGEQCCFEGKAYVRSHLSGKCCIIKKKNTWFRFQPRFVVNWEEKGTHWKISFNSRLFWGARNFCNAPVFNHWNFANGNGI